ncbi:MAG TPA: hypothetical protein PLB98_03440, partial [bacterium]|nr:hypothetical protein [bacterium]
EILNPLLTKWLVEYNFKRPYESLKKRLLTSFFSTKNVTYAPNAYSIWTYWIFWCIIKFQIILLKKEKVYVKNSQRWQKNYC